MLNPQLTRRDFLKLASAGTLAFALKDLRLDRALARRGRFLGRLAVRARQHFGNQDDGGGHQHGRANQAFFYRAFHGAKYKRRGARTGRKLRNL